MKDWFFDSQDSEQTLRVAAELGRSIGSDGLALALVGPLGAGKTVFVKGMAEGLGIDPRVVSSPTFVLAQQYPLPTGPEILHHVDLYRLESPAELESIGFDDMIGEGQVLAVEWADRFPDLFGESSLRIEFEGPSPEEEDAAKEGVAWRGRRARVSASGAAAESVLDDWAERAGESASSEIEMPSGGGSGSRIHKLAEARVGWMMLLALGVFFSKGVAFENESPICLALIEWQADELGTLHAGCVELAKPDSKALSGIARVLDGQRFDLNRASTRLLQTLPHVGPIRAKAIARARAERRGQSFLSPADLLAIAGIGPKTFGRIEQWLYVPTQSKRQPDEGKGKSNG